jgi:hypothetical protein
MGETSRMEKGRGTGARVRPTTLAFVDAQSFPPRDALEDPELGPSNHIVRREHDVAKRVSHQTA